MSQDEIEGGAVNEGMDAAAPDQSPGQAPVPEGAAVHEPPAGDSEMATDEAEAPPPIPSFPVRFGQVLFSPGALMEALARRPVWAVALLVAALLIALQTALIPWEVFTAFQRDAALQRGQTPPEIPANVARIMRVVTPIFAPIAAAIFTFVFTGLYTLIFAFILGDEGRYRQYLAVACHATLIPALVGLLLVPLKISQGNPQFTLNLGAFFFFVPEGYPLKVLTMLDISQIWAMLVTAVGVKAIDPRRSFGSAAAILLAFAVALAMIFARFVPTV